MSATAVDDCPKDRQRRPARPVLPSTTTMPSRPLAPTAIAKKITRAQTIDDLVAVGLLVALATADGSDARHWLAFELGQRAIAIAIEPHASSFNLAAIERRTITRALDHVDGNMDAAADLLGIGRATLYRRVAKERL